LPIGVRTASTMTASRMSFLLDSQLLSTVDGVGIGSGERLNVG
jgi:hypothetical protein